MLCLLEAAFLPPLAGEAAAKRSKGVLSMRKHFTIQFRWKSPAITLLPDK